MLVYKSLSDMGFKFDEVIKSTSIFAETTFFVQQPA